MLKVALAEDDPYQWLEDVTGKKALDYVEAQNAITVKELEARPEYAGIRENVLSILNSKAKIPHAHKAGELSVSANGRSVAAASGVRLAQAASVSFQGFKATNGGWASGSTACARQTR